MEVFCKLTVLHLPGSVRQVAVILNNFEELIEILLESVKMKKGEKFLHNTSNFYQEA